MIEGHTQYYFYDSSSIDQNTIANDPKKEVLLLIHGFPFDHRMWSKQIHSLSSRYRIIAPDLQSFGKSTLTSEIFSIDSMAEDLNALIGQLNAKAVHLCGFSMGGYVALRMIDLRPDLFLSLCLINTRADADNNEIKIKRFEKIRDLQTNHDIDDFADGFLKSAFAPNSLLQNPDLLVDAKNIIIEQKATAIAQALMALASRIDSQEKLQEINAPTLIIAGDQDSLIPRGASEILRDHIPDCRLEVLPETGHMSPLEMPHEVSKLISNFIESAPRQNEAEIQRTTYRDPDSSLSY